MSFSSPPDNIKAKIFNLLDLPSLLNTRLVSSNWSNFFSSDEMKFVIKDKLLAILDDISICKTITLLELQELVKEYLSDDHFKMDFFIALKKIEEKIMRATCNDAFIQEKRFLTITWEEIQPYLLEQFGISGFFHSLTLECIFGHFSIKHKAEQIARLCALEKVLQANSDPNALEFVNCLIKNNIIKLEPGFEFQFVNNQLYLAYRSEKFTLAEITTRCYYKQFEYRYSLDDIQKLVDKEIEVVMKYLQNNSTKVKLQI